METARSQEINSAQGTEVTEQGVEVMESNTYVQMVLASGSRFFLKGISGVIRDSIDDIKILTLASYQEIGRYLPELKPEILFLDNTTLKMEVQKLLNLITGDSPDTRIILLTSPSSDITSLSNIILIDKNADSSKLTQIITSIRLRHRRKI